jgi:RNA polymerase sigma factor (sigma-70 family)
VDTWISCAAAPFRRRLFAEWPDLLQDVRIELLGLLRAGRWRGEARLKTYIWRVTAHTCIDATRRQRRRPVHEPVEPDTPVASADPSPFDRMVDEGRERLLLEALDAVPPDCRDLWRRILNGMSYLDISRDLGVAEGALRVRAHRCRKKAVEALGVRAASGHVSGGNAGAAADAKG